MNFTRPLGHNYLEKTMKGTVFGYKKETDCANCGTERYGVDMDDDYAIFPGRIIEHPRCEEADVPFPWDNYPKGPGLSDISEFEAQVGRNQRAAETELMKFIQHEKCSCGGRYVFVRQPRGQWIYENAARCERSIRASNSSGNIEKIPAKGCQQCEEYHSPP